MQRLNAAILSLAGLLLAAWLAGCTRSPTVVKIGLIAPFEGADRAVGYDAIYAARLAVREFNNSGGIDHLRVALVALDDGGQTDLAHQTGRSLVLDPAVVAVLGHGLGDTTREMADFYAKAGLPFLPLSLPPFDRFDPERLPADFLSRYQAVTPFDEQPGPLAGPTYDAMQLIFSAMAHAAAEEGDISRQTVAKHLPNLEHQGITGTISFP